MVKDGANEHRTGVEERPTAEGRPCLASFSAASVSICTHRTRDKLGRGLADALFAWQSCAFTSYFGLYARPHPSPHSHFFPFLYLTFLSPSPDPSLSGLVLDPLAMLTDSVPSSAPLLRLFYDPGAFLANMGDDERLASNWSKRALQLDFQFSISLTAL